MKPSRKQLERMVRCLLHDGMGRGSSIGRMCRIGRGQRLSAAHLSASVGRTRGWNRRAFGLRLSRGLRYAGGSYRAFGRNQIVQEGHHSSRRVARLGGRIGEPWKAIRATILAIYISWEETTTRISWRSPKWPWPLWPTPF
jgi:hypothetical protein